MSLATRFKNGLRGVQQRWGTARTKQSLWNKEFSEGRWDILEKTSDDLVYRIVEQYSRRGSVLDLGCGSGNTGCELGKNTYEHYTGVDISDVALDRARQRSQSAGREQLNHYDQSDIVVYVPVQKHDVILFMESVYYIPQQKIRSALDRYAQYLTKDGVLIVRLYDKDAYGHIVKLIEANYTILEKHVPANSRLIVMVFRKQLDEGQA
jgi:SAM-dependent methyltransferase